MPYSDDEVLVAILRTYGVDGFDAEEDESWENIAGTLGYDLEWQNVREVGSRLLDEERLVEQGCYGLRLPFREVAAILVGKTENEIGVLLTGTEYL